MKCPDCESEMEPQTVPGDRILFTIPFTAIEIHAINYAATEWMCLECYVSKHDEPYRRAYKAGVQDGYNRAQDDRWYAR